ncbi:MAG: aspartyl protease family protein [Cyclobacteriaceae bacterium]
MILVITICFLIGIGPAVLAQNEYEVIEVIIMGDQPIVRGTINGKKAYLLLDTGADVSLLHSEDARHFGFSCHTRNSLKGFQLTGLGASVKGLAGVYDMDLQLGSQIIRADYIAIDLSDIIRSLDSRLSVRINGIIGSKALRMHGFLIDYHHKEVKMKLPNTDELSRASDSP